MLGKPKAYVQKNEGAAEMIGKEKKLIEVRGLKKFFSINDKAFKKKELRAVDDVSFSIKKGETLGLVGESGSGKTTVGRTLLYLYDKTEGEIYYRGKKIETKSDVASFRKNATMVFQDPYSSLDPRMTIADIVGEPLDVQNLYFTREERREYIMTLLSHVGLSTEHATRYAHEFSGGQRQRIGIARALAVNPDFIVCDEPVSALDVSIQAQIINMFMDLQESFGLTYLFIAHDLLVVRHISDRIAVMYLGKIMELGDADTICTKPLHPYTKALISSIPIADPRVAKREKRIILRGSIPSPIDKPSGCPFRTRCPYSRELCREKIPSFREIEKGHFVACHFAEKIS